jgi:hypothetical protein
MAGAFELRKYKADVLVPGSFDPVIAVVKVQPETLACNIGGTANPEPTAVVNSPFRAQVHGSSKQYGLHCRKVYLQAPATGQPSGYQPSGKTAIPALTDTFWNAAKSWTAGVNITYLGVAGWKVAGISKESYK